MAAVNTAGPAIAVPAGVPTLLRDLLHERTGIYFEPDRLDVLLDKLLERVRAWRLASFLDYFYLLKYEAEAEQEWPRVMDALSVPETYFWREYPQIRVLTEVIVPAWFQTRTTPLRIWSAACATGEEPYSIAISLREAGWGDHPIHIEASDGSEAALQRAETAVYRERSFRALPLALRTRYFEPAGVEGTRLRRDLLPNVTFRRANLVAPGEIAPLATAPVVFCRNVFIYFSPEAIRRTAHLLAESMPLGGHLFIGASESLLRLTTAFELKDIDGAFAYVRTAAVP